MTTKEHLKNYREYKNMVKYCDRKLTEGDTSDDLRMVRDRHARAVSGIERAVDSLADPTEQRLLRLRYFDGYSWTKVNFILHYSQSQTKRIHRRALRHLEGALSLGALND